MQKYKRPRKNKGLRSIPLRNPRKVDMYRFDPDTGRMRRLYERPSAGASRDSFANSPIAHRLPDGSGPKFVNIPIPSKPYLNRRLYYSAGTFWFIDRYTSTQVAWKSKIYYSRSEAFIANERDLIIFVCQYPYAEGD